MNYFKNRCACKTVNHMGGGMWLVLKDTTKWWSLILGAMCYVLEAHIEAFPLKLAQMMHKSYLIWAFKKHTSAEGKEQAHTNKHTHKQTSTHIQTSAHTNKQAHIHKQTSTHTSTHTQTHTYTNKHTQANKHTCKHTHMHIHTYCLSLPSDALYCVIDWKDVCPLAVLNVWVCRDAERTLNLTLFIQPNRVD